MQRENTMLVIGDKIDLTIDGKTFYKSRIDDVDRYGYISVSAPVYRQEHMDLRVFDEVYLVYYRDSGRYIVLARVIDILDSNDTSYPLLQLLTEPSKDQRREHYRLPVSSIDTAIYEYTEGAELTLSLLDDVVSANLLAEARARDISVTGIGLMTTKWECKVGDKYLLKLYFEGFKGSSPPFLTCATVVRSELTSESGIYDVGMQFFGMIKNKTEFLSKYILSQQQKRIMQQRLVEGDRD